RGQNQGAGRQRLFFVSRNLERMMQNTGLAADYVARDDVDLIPARIKHHRLLIQRLLSLRYRKLLLGIARSCHHVFKRSPPLARETDNLGVDVYRSSIDTALVLKGNV